MSIQIRISSIELDTISGTVRHSFSGPLTVLSGPVGVGKSTLFECIKYAIGGQARIAPIIRDHVSRIRLEIRVGDDVFKLTRNVGNGTSIVDVVDLGNGIEYGPLSISDSKSSESEQNLNSLLMNSMGLPTNAYSTGKKNMQRITFNNVWSFIYVEQREIDRSVARSNDTWAQPARRTTFELLFGLTDSRVLELKKNELEAEEALARAQREELSVLGFLEDSKTSTREEVEHAVHIEHERNANAQRRIDVIHEEAEAIRGNVGVVRDLVLQTRDEVSHLQNQLRELELSKEEHARLLSRLKAREIENQRAEQAASILAPIDFVICPRCAQSITHREHVPGACTLCLQQEPIDDQLLVHRSKHEVERLSAQRQEVETLLSTTEQAHTTTRDNLAKAQDNLANLETLLDERTRYFVSPRLEQYADAVAEAAAANAVLDSMNTILRQWDRAADIGTFRLSAEHKLEYVRAERKNAEQAVSDTRNRLLEALSADYRDIIAKIGVPTITEAHIDPRSYLPFANNDRFDKISTGGITTALVAAYWVTVLATALRERETNYPTLLIIDSPRKSIGSQNSRMVDELYNVLGTLAETYGDSMQVIVADNDIPSDISKRWQDIRFSYENPTVPTVTHPGPANVSTIDRD
ncbi:AAA family ATPase [Mycobacteroides abscessus]|uniref:AAA family ATPase n=1 Tax=Mycobacteroides abscessus TaxID=36809 RepID=UPI0005E5B617|nr:AAA family ATPase [Mycobacteroides abscessus]CPS05928.1 ATPase involved in DNA repair [Mycobacteroides abscessus]CPS17262.1 ATPase involved in DNA repair [Mycobacteroides abscessus]CPS22507.1 ATPase involved in DNA repair [Mycobacteroides abscessus]CPS90399.1 ATPase involved in DNA repair [Mycobacteroides abscessus]CPT45332.1 ATPase involved in DNA repair [Mycobacteroides abscessus]